MGNSNNRKRGQKVGRKKLKRYRRFWEAFLANRYKALLSYARRFAKGDDDRARDIVQEVFLRLWRCVPNPALITNHGAYVMRITRHVASNFQPHPSESSLDEIMESDPANAALVTEPDILDLLVEAERLEEVAPKKAGKKDEFYRRVQLHLEGHSIRHIAQILGEKASRTRYEWNKILKDSKKKSKK